MIELSKEAKEAKRAYLRQWRKLNKEKIKAYHKSWRKRNKDKLEQYTANLWEKKAAVADNVTDKLNATQLNATNELNATLCLNCGNSFAPKRKDAKFCSGSCRASYSRKNKSS